MTGADRTRSATRRLTDFVGESLRDSNSDLTSGPTRRALGLLAIPMMLEMSMEAIFAVVDIAFVSRLGVNAIATVGITEALVTVLYAISIGLGMGVTAMVSRRTGAGDPDGAAQAAGQAILLGAVIALAIGIIGVIYAADLLQMMGASGAVVETGQRYTAVLIGGSASILYLFLLNAAFRGAGDAPVALRALVLANSINIALDPCLIFGLGPFPELGVTGAAVATTIGRSIGVLYLAYRLFSPGGRLQLLPRHLALHADLIGRMVRLSIGGIGQFLIATASWIAVIRIVALFGSAPIAAYTIAIRMLEFVFLPAWGLGNAAAALVGQNLGAGKPDRAQHTAYEAARYNALFMAVLGIVLVAFAPLIVGLFTSDEAVLPYGISCLRILGVGFPIYAVGMIMVQALNGAGDTYTPSLLNFICFWLMQIPLAYWLSSQAGLGPNGAFAAVVASESALSILAWLVFRRGNWKSRQA
ncbi:MAG: MATE family efflux transporter [Gammaproteobacteria bacterium]|nr:MATE family efflux transporter [Gammaproteobacteria bacterium]MDH4315265.1 MATE family efflux transporter [Gammaproteobacteria bacterium]